MASITGDSSHIEDSTANSCCKIGWGTTLQGFIAVVAVAAVALGVISLLAQYHVLHSSYNLLDKELYAWLTSGGGVLGIVALVTYKLWPEGKPSSPPDAAAATSATGRTSAAAHLPYNAVPPGTVLKDDPISGDYVRHDWGTPAPLMALGARHVNVVSEDGRTFVWESRYPPGHTPAGASAAGNAGTRASQFVWDVQNLSYPSLRKYATGDQKGVDASTIAEACNRQVFEERHKSSLPKGTGTRENPLKYGSRMFGVIVHAGWGSKPIDEEHEHNFCIQVDVNGTLEWRIPPEYFTVYPPPEAPSPKASTTPPPMAGAGVDPAVAAALEAWNRLYPAAAPAAAGASATASATTSSAAASASASGTALDAERVEYLLSQRRARRAAAEADEAGSAGSAIASPAAAAPDAGHEAWQNLFPAPTGSGGAAAAASAATSASASGASAVATTDTHSKTKKTRDWAKFSKRAKTEAYNSLKQFRKKDGDVGELFNRSNFLKNKKHFQDTGTGAYKNPLRYGTRMFGVVVNSQWGDANASRKDRDSFYVQIDAKGNCGWRLPPKYWDVYDLNEESPVDSPTATAAEAAAKAEADRVYASLHRQLYPDSYPSATPAASISSATAVATATATAAGADDSAAAGVTPSTADLDALDAAFADMENVARENEEESRKDAEAKEKRLREAAAEEQRRNANL